MNKIKLGDVLEVKRGMSLPGEYYATEGDYIRLTLGNFNYPSCGWKKNVLKDNLFFTGNVRDEYILKKGDIITPLTEQVRGLLGNTATIPEDALYIQSGDIGLIIPDETKLDKRFSYYLVSSSVVKKQLDARSQQTKIRHTSPEAIKDCVAFIPIIKEQKKISYLLDCINKKIENNNAINDNLANTEQAILVETVINNHTVPTALGDLVDFIDGDRGKNYPTFDEFTSTGYCLFLNASNVTSTGFNFDNCMFVSEEKDKLMNKGHLSPYDIVLTSRGTLGNVALYDKHIGFENVRINSGMLIIRPKTKRLSPYFIYALLKSSYMKAAIERFKSGSAQPQLPIKDLQKITFEIPESDTVLVALDRQFLAVEESISINNNEIGNLKELSNVLLAELSR